MLPGGRPRLTSDRKAFRTSITLTKETHDRVVAAGLNVSAICEAALNEKVGKHVLLPDVQELLTKELLLLERELELALSDKQREKFAKIRKVLNGLQGSAFVIREE